MDKVVYILCSLTSCVCAILLLRGYLRSGMRLLLWSTICFACLFLANIIVYLDMVVFPEIDFAIFRNSVTLVGLCVLIYGMIWETV